MRKKLLYRILKWFFGIIAGVFLLISFLLWLYKDEICQMAINELNKNLKTKVQVSDVDLTFWSTFPNLSIDFNHVFIQDAIEGSTERDTLLYTNRIRCKLNPFDAWNENYEVKALEIEPGVLNLKVDSLGNNNYDIVKPSDEPGEDFDFKLENVAFENFRFTYTNAATNQEYETLIRNMNLNGAFTEAIFTTKAEADLQIIAARSGSITLVSNKPATLNIGVNVDTDSSIVEIPTSTIHIANLPFSFDGLVNQEGFHFELKGKDISIEEAANNLAMEQTKDVKSYSGTGNVLFDLNVDGHNDATTPVEVVCDFGVASGTLKDPGSGITLQNLSLEGKYSNIGGPDKEFLSLKNIGCSTTGGPFKGNLLITNFAMPNYKGNMNGLVYLGVVRSLFNLKELQQLKGTVDVASQFDIQALPLADGSYDYRIDKCNGQLKLNNVVAQLIDDKRVYDRINGKVFLQRNQVGMENITCQIGRSDFELNGVFQNVVNYFSKRGSLVADVRLQSKSIDMADLGSDTKEDKLERDRMFILPDNIRGDVYMDVGQLRYENHLFYAIKGDMSMKGRVVNFPRISLVNGGAKIHGSLIIEESRPEIFLISSHVVSDNINFKKLFKEWDNFQQNVISADNISGDAKANVKFEAPFDLRNGIILNAIKATVGIQVDNGRLKNVEAFKEITKSLNAMASARMAIGKENIKSFESKLLDLRFEQLKNTLIIRDGIITMPNMSIESSALNIEMSGKHTFDNKIDYRFGFRFRDLKQPETSEFGEIIDDGTGKHVFMRMYGDLYNPQFEWDKLSSKEHKKEMREQAKKDAKSMLKTGLGLFKNDTTVQEYIEVKRPHEELEIIIDPVDEIDELMEEKKPKKKKKRLAILNKMAEEAEKNKEEKNKVIIDID